jgi:serine phosphatase RsbU (regulator of sigma subunit)
MNKALEDSYKKLAEYNRTLEQRVEERTEVLNDTLNEVEAANQKIMESIQYAQMIQTSLLPNLKEVRTYLPSSFFIWMPRDIVGGDIFYTESFKKGFVVAVIDCTGHGVPGAFMTMIASSALRRVIHDEGFYIPGEILKRLNFIVKTSLQQDTEYALSDDGLDAAICFVEIATKTLIFSGARVPLVYIHNEKLSTVKGDRQSIGYKKSDLGFNFTNHKIAIEKGMCFYIATDGFADQLGEQTARRFGTGRYKELLRENAAKPFQKQKEILLEAFNEHKGMAERQDDITIVGFSVDA